MEGILWNSSLNNNDISYYFNLLIENKNLFSEDSCEITDNVKKDFFEEKCINYKEIKNKSDKIILLLAVFYDLKFNYSLDYIKENRIIDKLYDNVENKEKYKIYFEQIYKYFNKKIQ